SGAFASMADDFDSILTILTKEEYKHCIAYPEHFGSHSLNDCADYIYGVNNVLNDIWWDSSVDKNTVMFFDYLWENSEEIVMLENPLIKLNLAFLLGQSSWSGMQCKHCESLRSYTVSYILNDDIEIVASSLIALGVVGRPDDVVLLRPIILREMGGVAEKAVRTATKLLNDEKLVNEFLAELYPEIGRDSLRRYIERYMKD
ncbi:hypothetical protein, partial [Vibrio owensii]|uniref:hypothetical protein n=1 Tax=Vibrio owensii TaxID=696485 RepID=UPI001D11E151